MQFYCSEELVTFAAQRDRMMSCDVYVELFNAILDGKVYGSFGLTALEAAAMGKVVMTMNLHRKIYEKHYGECALFICNTHHDFISALLRIQFSDAQYIEQLRQATREWVVEKHSYEATGKRLKQLFQ